MFNLKDYNLNERAIDYITSLITNNNDFDEEKFRRWLTEKNVAFKDNPSSWIIKVFPTELERGVFKRIVYVPATQVVYNKMREMGIVVKQTDCMYIDLMLNAISKKLKKSKEETEQIIGKWCFSAIKYIVKKNEKPTSTHFIEVFKQSKSVEALGLDWEQLAKDSAEQEIEWEALILAIERG